MLALDLGVLNKKDPSVTFRRALFQTLCWISLALFFNLILYLYSANIFPNDARLLAIPGFDAAYAARNVALEFLTGYVIEYSLSVDNLFVFAVIFLYFGIPTQYQHRILFYGILGAVILRGIFIALGSILIEYEPVIWIFGGFLIFTGLQMLRGSDKEIEPEKNFVIRLLKKYFPVTESIENRNFFERHGGRIHITPLFIALVFLELTDVVFAVDSVPAIFAVTREPLIVFTSNIFAIIGLRSLYFLLAGALDLFYLLKYGLAIVLIFIGLKMVWLNHLFGGKFPILASLLIIILCIGGSIVISLLFPKERPIV